jgi:hypothetical protein
MNRDPSSQCLIGNENPSMTKAAVYQRLRRLNNEAFCDAVNASNRRSRSKKKQNEALKKNAWMTKRAIGSKALEDRVRFHLSRGRDASGIVMREGIKSSIILAIVAKIKAEA